MFPDRRRRPTGGVLLRYLCDSEVTYPLHYNSPLQNFDHSFIRNIDKTADAVYPFRRDNDPTSSRTTNNNGYYRMACIRYVME